LPGGGKQLFRSVLQKLKSLTGLQMVLIAAFIGALAFTSFYSYRTYQRAVFWREHRDEPIAAWMRIGFVANSYRVPVEELNKAVGVPPETRDRRPLSEIAASQGRAFEDLRAELQAAIRDFRAAHPHRPEDNQ
jgi:hypothetical protein